MENKIKEFITSAGISQKELAQQAGLSEAGLSKAINGSASMSTLRAIAQVLDVAVEDLIHGDMPSALYEGELKIGEVVSSVAVLDDGRRIIKQADVFKVLNRPVRGNTRVTNIPSFMDASNLQQFITEDVKAMTKRVAYRDTKGVAQNGYNCLLVPMVCEVYLSARDNGVLAPSQVSVAKKAEAVIRGLAQVGIIALVDEATGYNKAKDKAKDELQKFLSAFLRQSASRWVKTFDDQFFEDLYRMKGWNWAITANRPGVVGRIINDIVYLRLGPAVYQELRKRNPKNENGNRSHKHHQLLTDDVGKPKLLQHLEAIHALAVASDYNWVKFHDTLDKVYPRNDKAFSIVFEDYPY